MMYKKYIGASLNGNCIYYADQCRAMEVAIAEEWKDTIHRWCKWHVLRRVRECVGPYTQIREFRDEFHKMLNEMLTIDEFEKTWQQLLIKYGLTTNPFLQQVYETRHMWVKSYFKGVFCARMTSTQRSESANHMLKNLVQPNCPLHQFIQQYNKLQYIRGEEENYQEKKQDWYVLLISEPDFILLQFCSSSKNQIIYG